jgi:hypothetical protein
VTMFQNAGFFNQPLAWNTVSVKSVSSMFQSATRFNQKLCWYLPNLEWSPTQMFTGSQGSLLSYPACKPTAQPTAQPMAQPTA